MTLTQLEYIIALDTQRNFVQAAEKCFVTQPTLSMQIRKLEEYLGVNIFDRSKQPVVPTEIGMEIIEKARGIVNESYKLRELISDRKGEFEGELKVGVIPTIAPYLLPKVIVLFMKKYPKVKLLIWEYTTEQIIQDLKTGLLDCGLLSTPIQDQSLNEIHLFYENFVAYLSPSSTLMKKKELKSKDINPDELWLLNEGHCMRNQVLNICPKKKSGNDRQHFEYNTGSVETLKRMVDLNNGITILPELSLSDLSSKQMKRIRYFVSPQPTREISIVTHRDYLKRRLIAALQKEVLATIPDEMRSSKKKEIMHIYS
ncbi:MAG TPA: DNA-binding transcriptional regulator OxyR [Sphingobacteriaceae bacterium]|nr:DNA-binding transcriptional regulator OxyR [Sphingobacteriaceae bacterium]